MRLAAGSPSFGERAREGRKREHVALIHHADSRVDLRTLYRVVSEYRCERVNTATLLSLTVCTRCKPLVVPGRLVPRRRREAKSRELCELEEYIRAIEENICRIKTLSLVEYVDFSPFLVIPVIAKKYVNAHLSKCI